MRRMISPIRPLAAACLLRLMAVWAAGLCSPTVGGAQVFTDVTTSAGVSSQLFSTNQAWADYDGDGDRDLYVTHWGTATILAPINAFFRNEGEGRFVDVAADLGVDTKDNCVAAAWGDYDNDGDVDLYVADFFDQDYLYRNEGDSFREVNRLGAAGLNQDRRGNSTTAAWGDYDNDGDVDLYLGKYYFANSLHDNGGDGTFTDVTDVGLGDERDASRVMWVDYDNDGDVDLYAVNREQENALYRNEMATAGGFTAVACALSVDNNEIGQSGSWADYDNDGDMDLYLANAGGNALYRNDGAEVFVEVAQAAGVRMGGFSWLSADVDWADYDGDGDFDLYLASGADRQFQTDILFANNGDGTFSDASGQIAQGPGYHMAAAWGDYNGDGAPDLYVSDGGGLGNRMLANSTPADRFLRVRVQGRGAQQGGASVDGIGAQVRLLNPDDGTLVAYQQVLNGGAELVFGAAAGPFNIEVDFPGNDLPVVVGQVQGGDQVVVVEP
ncbi:MAG: hypothetical protein GKR89_07070 [Candidatus Latescibacteria bacterium]|nr:hypothetical protein [Candidatus Latescibacterota bacterium]